jgi:hypothetical protein
MAQTGTGKETEWEGENINLFSSGQEGMARSNYFFVYFTTFSIAQFI